MRTHVFLIDDDIDEMKNFVEALKEVIGLFKCTYASNGIHALKMLVYLKPEIIFIDYQMPAMNGLQVAEEIKKIKELQHIPLFLYSTQITDGLKSKAAEAGIMDCIEKLCNMEKLVATLKGVFRYT